tara:strand:+ start:302 stop:550 length:249 start_codon:yes stop_codon:yes gene_type:complete
MLKNPKKADLDKSGDLSSYEKKRGMAIEKNMNAKTGKMMKAMSGGEAMVASGQGFGIARKKGENLGDESLPMKQSEYIKDLV